MPYVDIYTRINAESRKRTSLASYSTVFEIMGEGVI